MKCQIIFSRENKNNIISLLSAEIIHGMISVNDNIILRTSDTEIDKLYFLFKISCMKITIASKQTKNKNMSVNSEKLINGNY